MRTVLPRLRTSVARLGGLSLLLLGLSFTQSTTAVALLPEPGAAGPSATAAVQVVDSTSAGIEMTLVTPPFSIDSTGNATVAGLEQQLSQPGEPALPYYATLIALPPQASVSVKVQLEQTASHVAGLVNPAPGAGTVPENSLANGLVAGVPALPQRLEPDPAVYDVDTFYPSASYSLSEPMYAGTLRVVELRLFPLRLNPVGQQLQQARRMNVSVSFAGSNLSQEPASSGSAPLEAALASTVLNYVEAQTWRVHDPTAYTPPVLPLPVGADTFKIAVDQTGIYEISRADLVAAGMNANAVNPNTIAMMFQGQPVAYEFVGDNDAQFENGETVRFYAWSFDGSRHDRNYVTDNIYWLWADASPLQVKRITSRDNEDSANHPVTNTFVDTITEEPELLQFNTWTNQWDTFPNEADMWYWANLAYTIAPGIPLEATYDIDLPDPAASGPDADLEVEMLSRFSNLWGVDITYVVSTTLNSSPTQRSSSWQGARNVNINQGYPLGDLTNGHNAVTVWLSGERSDASPRLQAFLNRISVTYTRNLKAVADQLIFQDHAGGPAELQVSGFSVGTAANVLIWDITAPTTPENVSFSGSNIQNDGGSFTYRIGSSHPANARFIATTNANFLVPKQLSKYVPANIEASPGADWVAISHANFLTQANLLASHRAGARFGALNTLVVDIEDVTNQYGFGLPLPQAVRDYLAHAYQDWIPAPGYVVLFGDASVNPRQLTCGAPPCSWPTTYVPTDIVAEDRFQGFIPSDLTMSLLAGNDLIPEIAIGRIPANTAAEAANMVSKIILYDNNVLEHNKSTGPQNPWLQTILNVADNPDDGGNFDQENRKAAAYLDDAFKPVFLEMTAGTPEAADAIRVEMSSYVNDKGISVLNYRGHGGINVWAHEALLDTTPASLDFWLNSDKPVAIVSADCSDGHFGWNFDGLGESIMRLSGRGSVSHWSSSGLGFTFEHTVLTTGLYSGIFDLSLSAIGDAVTYSKMNYRLRGYDPSELYAFVLLGDPAMHLYRPELGLVKKAMKTTAIFGEKVDFELELSNRGLLPVKATIVDTLPAALMFDKASSAQPLNVTVDGSTVTIRLQDSLAQGETEKVTISTIVGPGHPGQAINSAEITSLSLDTAPVNNADTASVNIINVAPLANPQVVHVPTDTSTTFDLNYVDPDGPGPFKFTIMLPPKHGTLTGSDGSRTYTPDTDFHGLDTFTWRVNDGFVDSDVVQASLIVSAAGVGRNVYLPTVVKK